MATAKGTKKKSETAPAHGDEASVKKPAGKKHATAKASATKATKSATARSVKTATTKTAAAKSVKTATTKRATTKSKTAAPTEQAVKAAPAKRTKTSSPDVAISTPDASASGSNGASRAPALQPLAGPPFPDTEYPVVEKLLVNFVSHEVRKVGLSKVVLGLSGGIDSAVSAAIAARALGPENVLGVFMPYRSSVPESEADANEVVRSLGIELVTVEITPQIDAYFELHPDASRLRRGNKMARERMTILYDHSAARSALVIGTSNKTELLLGYGTLYGDMASALNPIGDLYKTQVWGLARHLGLPASVIDKAPTADLWSGQTDENELGFSYHQVDRLLYRMIDERSGTAELVEMGFDEAFVERISRMVRSSQFKRRLPIIAKISARSIDTDFRYSRDWGL